MRPTKAIIDLGAFSHNVREVKHLLNGNTRLCCAVKADAYGHGAVRCARAALDAGADTLSVATVDEGRELRESGIECSILLLSLCGADEVRDAVRLRLTPFMFDAEYAESFERECVAQGVQRFPVHLAVDTGMGRIGCRPEDAGKTARSIARFPHLSLEGCATHFAVSDSASVFGAAFTARQADAFRAAIQSIRDEGLDPGIVHAAASAAILNNPELHFDMVRAGIVLYGYYPDEITREYLAAKGKAVDLRAVMTLESKITSIRTFRAGETVGYGCTWRAARETAIGVVPIGYADGWLRRYSDCGVTCAVEGIARPICGRICMDQCMIDLGTEDVPPRGSRVVLFGDKKRGALQDASDVARLASTISYEVTCCISKRVPRVYAGE